MFAPLHHSAMRHAVGPRREIGLRTLFNLLGPLTNPAGVRRQVLGVFLPALCQPLAEALGALGSEHALVVHSEDGLDEISIAGPTRVAELKDGEIHGYSVQPRDFGLPTSSLETLRVDSAVESLAMIRQVLAGEPGPARDIVALNAGAAIYAANLVEDLGSGVTRAQTLLDDGSAARVLERLVRFTREAAA
jgi:anthranilate phosphoribosyltransferase